MSRLYGAACQTVVIRAAECLSPVRVTRGPAG